MDSELLSYQTADYEPHLSSKLQYRQDLSGPILQILTLPQVAPRASVPLPRSQVFNLVYSLPLPEDLVLAGYDNLVIDGDQLPSTVPRFHPRSLGLSNLHCTGDDKYRSSIVGPGGQDW